MGQREGPVVGRESIPFRAAKIAERPVEIRFKRQVRQVSHGMLEGLAFSAPFFSSHLTGICHPNIL